MTSPTIQISKKIDAVAAALNAGDQVRATALGREVDATIEHADPLDVQRWAILADLVARAPSKSTAFAFNAGGAYDARGAWGVSSKKKPA